MLKKFISLLMLAVFAVGLWVAPAFAGHRIQDNNGGKVSLESRDDDVPEQATGLATFTLKPMNDGLNKMTVKLNVRNLPERAGRVYEVWLVNFDGTDLNLTAFDTDNDGDATTTVTRNVVNMAPYDRIIVTKKRRQSFQTSRTGDTVLSGRLH